MSQSSKSWFSNLIILLLTASLIACVDGKQEETPAPPSGELGLPGPTPPGGMEGPVGLSLAQVLETANTGCEAGNFEQCELSCEALERSDLPSDQMPNLACRCFFTQFFRWIESESNKTIQQKLCNGYTTVEGLFGENGYLLSSRREREDREREPAVENFIPCATLFEGESKEIPLKILSNLYQNKSNLDQLKPYLSQSANELKAILPTLNRVLSPGAQCSIPAALSGFNEDYVLKAADLFYLAGWLKLIPPIEQALSLYEFNLNPDKIGVPNLIVRDAISGEGKRLGLQFLHQFLVADANSEPNEVTASRHEGEAIIRPISRKFDDKPLGRLPRGTNLLSLKPDLQAAISDILQSQASGLEWSEEPRLMGEENLEILGSIQASLQQNSYFSLPGQERLSLNAHRALEFPLNIASVAQRDLPRNTQINFLKLEETQREISQFFCVAPDGEREEIDSCPSPSSPRVTRGCPESNNCEQVITRISMKTAAPNGDALLAATKNFFQINLEPQFGPAPRGSICPDGFFDVSVTDRDRGDRITLTLPRRETWPTGVFIEAARSGSGFRISGEPGTTLELGEYTVYLGASDGHGRPFMGSDGPTRIMLDTFGDPSPEVVQAIRFTVEACGGP